MISERYVNLSDNGQNEPGHGAEVSPPASATTGSTVTGKPAVWAEVDDQGRLVLPAELREQFGLERARPPDEGNYVRLHLSVTT